MSNIRFDSSAANIATYKLLLQSKIDSVCQKIGFRDTGVSWVIFDARKAYSNDMVASILVGTKGKDYGFFSISTNEIWISTKAIQHGSHVASIIKKSSLPTQNYNNDTDFLANIILDEITHFQTGADHGTTMYEKKFTENRNKYYGLFSHNFFGLL